MKNVIGLQFGELTVIEDKEKLETILKSEFWKKKI